MKRECPNRGESNCESNVAFHAFDSDGGELSEWVVDSGASNHTCASKSAFAEYRVDTGKRAVSVAKSGVKLRVLGVGTVRVDLNVNGRVVCATLENALHVENLSHNLFSIPAILSKSMRVEMDKNGCKIVRNGVTIGSGTKRGSLIYLDVVEQAECRAAEASVEMWHRRLGHASVDSVTKMMKSMGIEPSTSKLESCDVCARQTDTDAVPHSRRLPYATRRHCVGYLENQKGYRLLDVVNGWVLRSRSVSFVESFDSVGNVSDLEAVGRGFGPSDGGKSANAEMSTPILFERAPTDGALALVVSDSALAPSIRPESCSVEPTVDVQLHTTPTLSQVVWLNVVVIPTRLRFCIGVDNQ